MHLKTSDGQSAVVVGGSVPAVHDGWMWDLTVPGNNDHDFYVVARSVSVLVHNANCSVGTTVYRGVPEDHPGFGEATEGIASPRGGTSSAEMHQLGYTDSPYVSWTTNPSVAARAAQMSGSGRGVVLQAQIPDDIPFIDVNSQSWADPDLRGEFEVLLQGTIHDADVTYVGRWG